MFALQVHKVCAKWPAAIVDAILNEDSPNLEESKPNLEQSLVIFSKFNH